MKIKTNNEEANYKIEQTQHSSKEKRNKGEGKPVEYDSITINKNFETKENNQQNSNHCPFIIICYSQRWKS